MPIPRYLRPVLVVPLVLAGLVASSPVSVSSGDPARPAPAAGRAAGPPAAPLWHHDP